MDQDSFLPAPDQINHCHCHTLSSCSRSMSTCSHGHQCLTGRRRVCTEIKNEGRAEDEVTTQRDRWTSCPQRLLCRTMSTNKSIRIRTNNVLNSIFLYTFLVTLVTISSLSITTTDAASADSNRFSGSGRQFNNHSSPSASSSSHNSNNNNRFNGHRRPSSLPSSSSLPSLGPSRHPSHSRVGSNPSWMMSPSDPEPSGRSRGHHMDMGPLSSFMDTASRRPHHSNPRLRPDEDDKFKSRNSRIEGSGSGPGIDDDTEDDDEGDDDEEDDDRFDLEGSGDGNSNYSLPVPTVARNPDSVPESSTHSSRGNLHPGASNPSGVPHGQTIPVHASGHEPPTLIEDTDEDEEDEEEGDEDYDDEEEEHSRLPIPNLNSTTTTTTTTTTTSTAAPSTTASTTPSTTTTSSTTTTTPAPTTSKVPTSTLLSRRSTTTTTPVPILTSTRGSRRSTTPAFKSTTTVTTTSTTTEAPRRRPPPLIEGSGSGPDGDTDDEDYDGEGDDDDEEEDYIEGSGHELPPSGVHVPSSTPSTTTSTSSPTMSTRRTEQVSTSRPILTDEDDEDPFLPTEGPYKPTTTTTRSPPAIVPTSKDSSKHDFSYYFSVPLFPAVFAGAIVGLLSAILLLMFMVYRMRKKDEGSYVLGSDNDPMSMNGLVGNGIGIGHHHHGNNIHHSRSSVTPSAPNKNRLSSANYSRASNGYPGYLS